MRLGTNRAEEVRQDLIAASQLLVHLLVSRLAYLVVLCCCIQAPSRPLPVYLLFASPFPPVSLALPAWKAKQGLSNATTSVRPSVRPPVCLSRGNSE